MVDIRSFIQLQLLEPLKNYSTVVQDTMIEIITQRLVSLYEYSVQFPEIVSPNQNRLDILRAIAAQFLFTVREEADLQEQVNILDNILYVYRKRGSIDTIENMWKYYGGDLPKDVKVIVPAEKLFRYSGSRLSGSHVFPNDPKTTGQGDFYRTGAYEISLINNTYPIEDLREFLLKELVAAGNFIYFSNIIHMSILPQDTPYPYIYDVSEDILINSQMETSYFPPRSSRWSQIGDLSGTDHREVKTYSLSGNRRIFFELYPLLKLGPTSIIHTLIDNTVESILIPNISDILYHIYPKEIIVDISFDLLVYCTCEVSERFLVRDLYDASGHKIVSQYPGYFILGETQLGKDVI